jgi:Secretion system C-terminal sorting domain
MNFKLLLSTSFIVLSLSTFAQDANSSFAITGKGAGDFQWVNVRQVNIKTGLIERTVYDNSANAVMTNAFAAGGQTQAPAMGYGVAAAAYDKVHNRLYYTQMHYGVLSYIDLNKKEPVFNFPGALIARDANAFLPEENHITRMVIGADGNGYAITNDANHLIRFTTGKKAVITDLGNLVDAESNKGLSVHNKCSSWGGDMIADAYNKLYVISANHNIFTVDIDTRIATFVGTITGLPANYSTNGAAVDTDGEIVVSSANTFEGYYKFKINDFAAVRIEGSDKTYNASDLANGNLLLQKEADAAKNFGTADFRPIVPVINADAHIYPNPVTNNEFKVSFEGQQAGRYIVTITDLSGKPVMNRLVTISTKTQVETIPLNRSFAKGMYMVKVTDAGNKFIFTERIVVQ